MHALVPSLLMTALALGAFPAAATGQSEAEIGIARGLTPSPLVLEDVAGGEVDLADVFGKRPVLLEFWAAWCENCKALHPYLQRAHEVYGDRVDFYAIAVAVGQSKKSVRRELEKTPVRYPTLWDGAGKAVREFKVPATSYVVILDAEGRVAYTGLGGHQDIEAAVAAVLAGEEDG